MKKGILIVVGIIILILIVGFIFHSQFFKPTESSIESGVNSQDVESEIEIVARDLEIPWEIVFLPDGEMLVTERSGKVLKIGDNGREAIKVSGVEHVGEGGLLGMVLHPSFEDNNWIYLYLTTDLGEGFSNRIERYRLVDGELLDKFIVIENIPGARFHDGGRMAFGPDGYLYVTTGDAGEVDLAQDLDSLAGKLLRLNDDGKVPEDNPFGTEIYSYGHRNSQGIVWDVQGRLWSTEHGRSGIKSGLDELNLIVKGGNYGWPTIQGDETREGMITPVINSGPDETWAPAGAAYFDNRIFFVGLRGETLYEFDIEANLLKAHFRSDFGRLRVATVKDDYLYIATSNRDGRGSVREGDDKIIRIDLNSF